jgi:Ca2+-binding RTX toxin-like protein
MALNGTSGNDKLRGTVFADEIFGFGGDDTIGGSPGADTINGGSGRDTVNYSEFQAGVTFIPGGAVDVDLERATQSGGLAEGDVLAGVENVIGSREDDVIRGDDADNGLHGSGGDDILEGRDGDDLLTGDVVGGFFGLTPGNDRLDGGAGNDRLLGNEGDDTLIGGSGDDELLGEAGDDLLFGDPGVDRLDGGAGVDTATYVNAATGVNVDLAAGVGLGGDAAGDVLISVENLNGSDFADTLTGSSGANILNGGVGNDVLAGLGGADVLHGGAGQDTASYAASGAGVTVDLSTGTASGGDATGDTLISIERLLGSGFTDVLVGNALANVLDGGGGADLLAGGGGNDTYVVDSAGDVVIEAAGQGTDNVRATVSFTLAANIENLTLLDAGGAIDGNGNALDNVITGNGGDNVLGGGGGADTLIGARGIDTLIGGAGGDRFVWRDVAESGNAAATADTIVDFDPLAGDLIDLGGVDANALAAGNQAFTFIGAAGFSGTPGEINFVHVDGDTIIQLQTGVVGDVEMAIRIEGIVTPEAGWFVL